MEFYFALSPNPEDALEIIMVTPVTDFEVGLHGVGGMNCHRSSEAFRIQHLSRSLGMGGSDAGNRGTKRVLKGQAWEPVLSKGLQLGARGQSTADKFPRNSCATPGLESEVWPPGRSCRKEESPFLQPCPR